MDKFNVIMLFIGEHEWGNRPDGAYTNDPVDPGGETKFGISKRAHPNLDIKNLQLPDALAIYKAEYWTPIKGDDKPFDLACAMMDTAVNCGVSKALKWGELTVDPVQYLQLRWSFYNWLAEKNPTQQRFLKGWRNRVNDLRKFIDLHKGDFGL